MAHAPNLAHLHFGALPETCPDQVGAQLPTCHPAGPRSAHPFGDNEVGTFGVGKRQYRVQLAYEVVDYDESIVRSPTATFSGPRVAGLKLFHGRVRNYTTVDDRGRRRLTPRTDHRAYRVSLGKKQVVRASGATGWEPCNIGMCSGCHWPIQKPTLAKVNAHALERGL